MRVEGRAATLYEGTVRTTADPVDGGDGSGAHDCNAGASPASALTASGVGWAGRWNRDFRDFFLDRVASETSDPQTASYWSVLVDWRYAAGVCRGVVPANGEVLLAYGGAGRILRLDGPARAGVGEPFAVTVRDGWVRASTGADGGPVAGASVGGGTTGDDGRVVLRFATSGLKRLKATAPDAIRSNALDVCVGDERCEGALPPPAPPGAGPPTAGARLAIAVPAAGERYARGGSTLLFRGTAPGAVDLRLAGRHGRRCIELAPGGRLTRRTCGATPAAVRLDGQWSVALRRRLPPGTYRLTATADGRTVARRFTVAAAPATVRAAVRHGGRWLRTHRGSTPLFADWAAIALREVAPRSRAYRRAAARVRAVRRIDLAALQRAALVRATPRILAAIARRRRADGSWPGGVDATAYSVIALRGSRHRAAVRAGRAWLRAHPPAAGPDTIGAVLWALGRGAPRDLVTRLHGLQNPDGGFGEPSNAQSTALAVIGLDAAGARVARAGTGISGTDYLRARQTRSGRVAYALGDRRTPVWVTAQAVLALAAAQRRDDAWSTGLEYGPVEMRPLRYSINVALDGCCHHEAGLPRTRSRCATGPPRWSGPTPCCSAV